MTIIIEGSKPNTSSSTQSMGKLILDPPPKAEMQDILKNSAAEFVQGKITSRVGGYMGSALSKILGPLSFLSDPLISMGKDHLAEIKKNTFHLEGIRHFSDKNIPGFVFQEAVIDGVKVRIGVDASEGIKNPKSDPLVIVQVVNQGNSGDNDDSQGSKYFDSKNPDLRLKIDAMKSKATADIEGYKQNIEANLPAEKQIYIAALKEFADEVLKASPDDISKITPPINPLGAETRYQSELGKEILERSQDIANGNFVPKSSLSLGLLAFTK